MGASVAAARIPDSMTVFFFLFTCERAFNERHSWRSYVTRARDFLFVVVYTVPRSRAGSETDCQVKSHLLNCTVTRYYNNYCNISYPAL